MAVRDVIHENSGVVLVKGAKWCDSFVTKLRGFTFRSSLAVGEGLVLVDKKDNRVNTAIHMMFVGMDLGVLWVNNAGIVVDTVIAKPWKLSYAPQAPARYVIESNPEIVAKVSVGDKIIFK
jgi:uncharacterized membrane protein (UPF0127 family)